MGNNQSRIDPSRKTAGAIYRDAALNNTDAFVVNGDLTNELMKSYVDDLNDTIVSNPYDNKPFYITVYEKKDLLMKRAILRRLYTTKYRPYPEPNTDVYFVEPRSNTTKFCWSLPADYEMANMVANEELINKEMIADIKAWLSEDLKYFGFCRINGHIVPEEHSQDRSLKNLSQFAFHV